MEHLLARARGPLADITPLFKDCGGLCAAACCRDDQDEGLGMLLFPKEDELYAPQDADWMDIVDSDAYHLGQPVPLLICQGRCPRDKRPLACRIFPLGPKVARGKLSVRMDPRARGLCPLAPHGVRGLSQPFVHAVAEALDTLWQHETHKQYLIWLSRQIDAHDDMLRTLLRT